MLRNQRGDTIVEVLIALAVIGLTISTGYSIATRSLNGVQVSNERSEATKVAEGQIERLIASVRGGESVGPTGSNPAFCFFINSIGETETRDVVTVAAPGVAGDYGDCQDGPDGRYKIAILEETNMNVPCYNDSGPPSKLTASEYAVNVQWDRIGGGQQQVVELNYRIPRSDCS